MSEYIEDNSFAEFIAVEVKDYKTIIFLLYRHPVYKTDQFLNTIDNVLSSSKFCKNDNKIIIIGDFNVNIINNSCKSLQFLNQFHEYGFEPLS